MNTWIEIKDKKIRIDLRALFHYLLRKLWIIIGVTLLCGAIGYAFAAFLVTPSYQASIKMYVNNKSSSNEQVTQSDIQASISLVDTYAIVLTSRPTVEAVIAQSGLNYSYEQVSSMISASSINNTEIFRVTVTADDPQAAAIIANAIAEVAPAQITSIVSGSSVTIVENAVVPAYASAPILKDYITKGALIGFLLSLLGILSYSLLFRGLSVEDRIKQNFELSVLSVIPRENDKSDTALIDELSFETAETYKLLRTNTSFCLTDTEGAKVIGVTSSSRGEGKTTLAINYAYSLAQLGMKVCLVEGDLRIPSISQKIKVNSTPGLTDLLTNQARWSEVFQRYAVNGHSIQIITAGDIPPNPSELLGSMRMKDVMSLLREKFDYIILDLPPVGIVSDPLEAKALVDGMLFVVSEKQFDRRTMADAIGRLKNVDAKVLGAVITSASSGRKEYGKYGSYREYGSYSSDSKTGKA